MKNYGFATELRREARIEPIDVEHMLRGIVVLPKGDIPKDIPKGVRGFMSQDTIFLTEETDRKPRVRFAVGIHELVHVLGSHTKAPSLGFMKTLGVLGARGIELMKKGGEELRVLNSVWSAACEAVADAVVLSTRFADIAMRDDRDILLKSVTDFGGGRVYDVIDAIEQMVRYQRRSEPIGVAELDKAFAYSAFLEAEVIRLATIVIAADLLEAALREREKEREEQEQKSTQSQMEMDCVDEGDGDGEVEGEGEEEAEAQGEGEGEEDAETEAQDEGEGQGEGAQQDEGVRRGGERRESVAEALNEGTDEDESPSEILQDIDRIILGRFAKSVSAHRAEAIGGRMLSVLHEGSAGATVLRKVTYPLLQISNAVGRKLARGYSWPKRWNIGNGIVEPSLRFKRGSVVLLLDYSGSMRSLYGELWDIANRMAGHHDVVVVPWGAFVGKAQKYRRGEEIRVPSEIDVSTLPDRLLGEPEVLQVCAQASAVVLVTDGEFSAGGWYILELKKKVKCPVYAMLLIDGGSIYGGWKIGEFERAGWKCVVIDASKL